MGGFFHILLASIKREERVGAMRTWAIIGGDGRQISMLENFRQKQISVCAWGIGRASTASNWRSAVRNADVVALPLPATADGVRIRCPLQEELGVRFSNLLEELKPNATVYGGKIPPLWVEQAEKRGIRIHDYFSSEALQMRNALPTVEGAILLALQALPVTLQGCSVAVLGYGRIASLLAERLLALGADVTVYARKERDLEHARLRRCKAKALFGEDETSSLCELSSDCRIVFNTVPQRIVTESVLRHWRGDCVLMELASLPGGFDTVAAEKLSFPLIIASALPGKYFPETAGNILADVLIEMEERSASIQ